MTALALPDLAQAIEAEHQAAYGNAKRAIGHAAECGRLLIEAKAGVEHGGWLPWVEANLSFGDRQARKYMRLAHHWPEIRGKSESSSDLTLADAMKLLSAGDNGNFRTSFNTGQNEWYTPGEYLECARSVLGNIDSCALAQRQVQAARYFARDDDGLTRPWHGRVWLNPPYSQPDIVRFVQKLVGEVMLGNVEQAILLTHNYSDTAWFHMALERASAVCFTRGRVKFYGTEGEVAAPTNGQTFFYFGAAADKFATVFSDIGAILWPEDRP